MTADLTRAAAMLRRKLLRLLGVRSPSEWVPTPAGWERWEDISAAVTEGLAAGIRQASARRAELLASGMTPDEAQAALLRELVLETDPAAFAYAEGVTRRSFPGLYEDDEE